LFLYGKEGGKTRRQLTSLRWGACCPSQQISIKTCVSFHQTGLRVNCCSGTSEAGMLANFKNSLQFVIAIGFSRAVVSDDATTLGRNPSVLESTLTATPSDALVPTEVAVGRESWE
ncbi:unnamed protein product, partial [Ectocarpus sp. 12 AP-2014]